MSWKRWTVCLLSGHKWLRLPYGDHDDSGFYLRCQVCSHQKDEPLTPPGMIIG